MKLPPDEIEALMAEFDKMSMPDKIKEFIYHFLSGNDEEAIKLDPVSYWLFSNPEKFEHFLKLNKFNHDRIYRKPKFK